MTDKNTMSWQASLPKDPSFSSDDDYVASLLQFVSSCELFQKLCGGVHILDFLTKEPDLYSTILPQDWRLWFELHEISDILYLLMHEDVSILEELRVLNHNEKSNTSLWRDKPIPPLSLMDYILTIRRHSLHRKFNSKDSGKDKKKQAPLQRHVAVGMKEKKIHEVQNFAQYIDNLSEYITDSGPHEISHIIDFGSGQNYLGRALASSPYNKKVIALESKQLNIDGARKMDVHAKLAEKKKTICNKKQYRSKAKSSEPENTYSELAVSATSTCLGVPSSRTLLDQPVTANKQDTKITYLETIIRDGDLSKVIENIAISPNLSPSSDPQLMVISLHSCGNLLHHGVRSLVLNPDVKAIAMVGCCYNLVTERLGPPTSKMPSLRSINLRLDAASSACDPHGFPMSEKLATFQHAYGEGIRFNITARMMAVQAPQNWTTAESESFFTRHFYRALLQRIFLDRGVVARPIEADDSAEGGSPREWTGKGPPIVIGSLRRGCYTSFKAYVRGALKKLSENSEFAKNVEEHMLNVTDEDLERYEIRFQEKKKALSIIWSLMAFSACVVESAILVDRWQFLKEQKTVKECWVETVFDYGQSPRNLVVVAIKK